VQREGGIDGLCAESIRLALSYCASAVQLVIGQPQSVTSPPYIRQHGQLQDLTSTACPTSASTTTAGLQVTATAEQLL